MMLILEDLHAMPFTQHPRVRWARIKDNFQFLLWISNFYRAIVFLRMITDYIYSIRLMMSSGGGWARWKSTHRSIVFQINRETMFLVMYRVSGSGTWHTCKRQNFVLQCHLLIDCASIICGSIDDTLTKYCTDHNKPNRSRFEIHFTSVDSPPHRAVAFVRT